MDHFLVKFMTEEFECWVSKQIAATETVIFQFEQKKKKEKIRSYGGGDQVTAP